MPDRKILVNDVRVRGIGRSEVPEDVEVPRSSEAAKPEKVCNNGHKKIPPKCGKKKFTLLYTLHLLFWKL